VGKHSAVADKVKSKLGKKQRLHEDEREKAREDAVLEIDEGIAMTLPVTSSSQAGSSTVSQGTKQKVALDAADDSDSGNEVEEQERILAAKVKGKGKSSSMNGPKAFQQRDLVAMAFAGDNVVQVCVNVVLCI
jgi:U3 small nucleolar RNA-associated protein 14